MTLLITIFLVLVNIFNTITTNIPKAEGLTAIEAFVIVCVLFVFGALMGKIFINETKEIFLLMEDYTEYISSRGLSDRLPKIGEIQIVGGLFVKTFGNLQKPIRCVIEIWSETFKKYLQRNSRMIVFL